MTLKALAEAVLQRNRLRNQPATEGKKPVARVVSSQGPRATACNSRGAVDPMPEPGARATVFEYRLADHPERRLVMISPRETSIEAARRRLAHQFSVRVLEVRKR